MIKITKKFKPEVSKIEGNRKSPRPGGTNRASLGSRFVITAPRGRRRDSRTFYERSKSLNRRRNIHRPNGKPRRPRKRGRRGLCEGGYAIQESFSGLERSLSSTNRLYEYPTWPRLVPLANKSLLILSIVLSIALCGSRS